MVWTGMAEALHLWKTSTCLGRGFVSFGSAQKWAAGSLILLMGLTALAVALVSAPAIAQDELTRKVQTKAAPVYPDLARRMNIAGTVKVIVVVAPNGTLKTTRVLGGNPVLVNAAVDALKKWKFEPASQESTGTVEFKFEAPH
jgi:TonB family protein